MGEKYDKVFHIFSTITINIPAGFFAEVNILIRKLIKIQGTQNSQSQNNLEKEQSGRNHTSQF